MPTGEEPTDRLVPRDAADVAAVVAWAVAEKKTLEVVGRGSKRLIGLPPRADLMLDVSALSGVTLYEPEELVLSAHAGTPLSEIEALLDSRHQALAFEPMDYGPLFGIAERGSIGGVIAANLSGPRRIKAGAARDHFLGVAAVSGRGEAFKSGGRVVKNVTGYDLCKLLAGSWGTLAVMTAVTVKTVPKHETEATVAVSGMDDAAAVAAMAAAMGSSCEVSGAAHLPAPVAGLAEAGLPDGRAATVLRVEGVQPSVASRSRSLAGSLAAAGGAVILEQEPSRALWRAVRDVWPFAMRGPFADRLVWRISTTPSAGAALAKIVMTQTDARVLYDWAGGLVWLALAPSPDAGAVLVRRAVAACGGHATLIRAPHAVRATTEVMEPQPDALAALTRRVKHGFDPEGVLNPARMWAGV